MRKLYTLVDHLGVNDRIEGMDGDGLLVDFPEFGLHTLSLYDNFAFVKDVQFCKILYISCITKLPDGYETSRHVAREDICTRSLW